MSLDKNSTGLNPPIGAPQELTQWFLTGMRPDVPDQVGLEHEKFLYRKHDGTPVRFEGVDGIRAVLEGFEDFGYQPIRDGQGGALIAEQRGGETITTEPGGQFELSGKPHPTARAAHADNLKHLAELGSIVRKHAIGIAFLGCRPFGARSAMPWMPKLRYQAMRTSLGARGAFAPDMMLSTATGQVNLDYHDEADVARKVTIGARISPLLVAMYANSPIFDGRATGYMSWRSHIWSEVDVTRTGYPDCICDGNFTFTRYVDWALDAPMLFLRRAGEYLMPALTFRQFLAQGYQGEAALQSDWEDHLSTMFPEVRVKRTIELRAADCVSPALTGALLALARGLLYDAQALEEVGRMLPALRPVELRAAHADAQRRGLGAQYGTASTAALAKELVALAAAGLRRLDPLDGRLLEPLAALVATGASPAEQVLRRFEKEKNPEVFLEDYGM